MLNSNNKSEIRELKPCLRFLGQPKDPKPDAGEWRETLFNVQVQVLEKVATGAPLGEILDSSLRLCEEQSEEMLCSILLLDSQGKHLRHGAAPSLPAEYMRSIDGSAIGPCAGSCGTAAFRGQAVIVEDIETDPCWAEYRKLARPHGLRACWSTPIFDSHQKVLGTFAIYYRLPGRPTERHLELIGIITHLMSIAITRHQTEAALRQSEKMTAIGQLAGGIAHDFNNQLSIILGYAELLCSRLSQSDLIRFSEPIVIAAKRSGELTKNLLSFSRQGHFEKVLIDFHELIDEVLDLLGHTIDRRIVLKREFRADHAFVLGDPTRIQNAILNLALNARDAIADSGTILISTAVIEADGSDPGNRQAGPTAAGETMSALPFGTYLRVSVTDTGSGMTEETKSRIFEPFFTTKPAGKGTGLGLAAVFGTVKIHGGWISVDTRLGVGSAFHIYLPLAERKSEAKGVVADQSPQGVRILVVEDELQVREMLDAMLSIEGHAVTTANGGNQALAIYGKRWRDIDLVILDMVMADMSGYETFFALQRINPSVKVLISSGYGSEGKVQDMLKNGALGLLQKPYLKGQLDMMIAKALASR